MAFVNYEWCDVIITLPTMVEVVYKHTFVKLYKEAFLICLILYKALSNAFSKIQACLTVFNKYRLVIIDFSISIHIYTLTMIHVFMKLKILLSIFMLLICINTAAAAVLHGTVYDLDLKPMLGAVIEIDTTPQQRMVVMDGTYSFSVPSGDYKITASYTQNGIVEYSTEEAVTIANDGDYVYDLFLFPDLSLEDEMLDEADVEVEEVYEETSPSYLVYAIIFLLFMIAFIVFYKLFMLPKSLEEKKEEDFGKDDINKVIEIIKKQGGRTTQKEIRKEMPLSEAKISLLITELEHQDKIEKIKKGRGNVIILK